MGGDDDDPAVGRCLMRLLFLWGGEKMVVMVMVVVMVKWL